MDMLHHQFILYCLWISDLSNKIEWELFQAVAVLVLLYGCTTWTNKILKKKKKWIDGNYTRMLHAVLNKSWKQHPTKQEL